MFKFMTLEKNFEYSKWPKISQGVAFRTKWTGILDRLGKMDRTGGVREWRGFGGAISGIPRDAKLPEIEPKPRALDFN